MTRLIRIALLAGLAVGCGSIAENEPDGTADGTNDGAGEATPDGADADSVRDGDGGGVEDTGEVNTDVGPDAVEVVADDGVGETTADDGGVGETGDAVVAECGNREVEPPEECDDGNDVPDDGCDNSCRFSCREGADCADGNPCTDDVCDPAEHVCSNPPLDIACNDDDPCTVGDWCERGDCVPEATLPVGYPDTDDDGFGDESVEANCGEGFVPYGTDCCDSVFEVNPAQTGWLTVAVRCGSDVISPTWDYNCSGTIETQYPAACARCEGSAAACTAIPGWEFDASGGACLPPGCGGGAHWLSGFSLVWNSTGARCMISGAPTIAYRQQGCH